MSIGGFWKNMGLKLTTGIFHRLLNPFGAPGSPFSWTSGSTGGYSNLSPSDYRPTLYRLNGLDTCSPEGIKAKFQCRRKVGPNS